MDAFGRSGMDEAEAEAPSGRGGRRDSFLLTARLRLADAEAWHEGRVRNLSPGGMMVELDRVVAPGVAVMLEIRGLGELTGQVAWCTRGRIGVALDAPIDPRLARKPVGGGAATPAYAKAPLVAPRRR